MHPTLAQILHEAPRTNIGTLALTILHTDPQGQHQHFTQNLPEAMSGLSLGQMLEELHSMYTSSSPQLRMVRQRLTPPVGYTGIIVQAHIQQSELPKQIREKTEEVDDGVLAYVIHAEPNRDPDMYLAHHSWPQPVGVEVPAHAWPLSFVAARALATVLAEHTPHTSEPRTSHLGHLAVHSLAVDLASTRDGIYSIHAHPNGYEYKLMTTVDYNPLDATTVSRTFHKLSEALKSPSNREAISQMIDPNSFEGVALSITGPDLDQSISDTLSLASINGALLDPDQAMKAFKELPTRHQVCVATVDGTVFYSERETYTGIRYTRDQTSPIVLASSPTYLALLTDPRGADDIDLPNDDDASSHLANLVSVCITENDQTTNPDDILVPLIPTPPPIPAEVELSLERAHMLATAISSTENTGLYLLSATSKAGHPCTQAMYISPPPGSDEERLFQDPGRMLSALANAAHDAPTLEALGLPVLDEDSAFQGLAFLVRSRSIDSQLAQRILKSAETGDDALTELLEEDIAGGRIAMHLTLALVDGSTYLHSTHTPDGTHDMPSHTTSDMDDMTTTVTDTDGTHPGHYTDHYAELLPLVDDNKVLEQGPPNPLGKPLHKTVKTLAALYR